MGTKWRGVTSRRMLVKRGVDCLETLLRVTVPSFVLA